MAVAWNFGIVAGTITAAARLAASSPSHLDIRAGMMAAGDIGAGRKAAALCWDRAVASHTGCHGSRIAALGGCDRIRGAGMSLVQ